MKNTLLPAILLLLFWSPTATIAQDITGVWKGEIVLDAIKDHPAQTSPYEIIISDNNGKLSGYAYITMYNAEGKAQVGVMEIKVKQKDDQVTIEDEGYIDNNFERAPPKQIKKTMELTYSKKDTMLVMKGSWHTNKSKVFLEVSGTAFLQRKDDYKETALYKKLDSLKLSNQLVINEPTKQSDPVAVKELQKEEIKAIVAEKPKPVQPIIQKPAPVVVKVEPPKPEPVIAKIEEPAKPKPEPVAVKQPEPPKPIPAPEKKPVALPVAAAPKPVPPPVAVKPQPKPVPVAAPKPVVKPAPPPVVAVAKPQPAAKPVAPPPVPVSKPVPPPVVRETAIVSAAVAKQAATAVMDRKTNTLQNVFYKSDSLTLTLYDNGEIDGDTVSVLMNGKVIIARQGLNIKPNSKTIYINKDTPDSILLVMYAENLGSIPPNTGLLVVHDGDAVYEVRFSADLKTNAAILLQRRKDE